MASAENGFQRARYGAAASFATSPSGFPSGGIGGIMGTMPLPIGQKITFGEMRSSGVRGLLIYCADF